MEGFRLFLDAAATPGGIIGFFFKVLANEGLADFLSEAGCEGAKSRFGMTMWYGMLLCGIDYCMRYISIIAMAGRKVANGIALCLPCARLNRPAVRINLPSLGEQFGCHR